MKYLYSDVPGRRIRQVCCDLLALVWLAMWVILGSVTQKFVVGLAQPAQEMAKQAQQFGESVQAVKAQLRGLPLVGGNAQQPLERAQDAAFDLARLGEQQTQHLELAGLALGLLVAIVPIGLLVAYYIPQRVRYAHDVRSSRLLLGLPGGVELFALRALTTMSITELSSLGTDTVTKAAQRDPDSQQRLAAALLRKKGISPKWAYFGELLNRNDPNVTKPTKLRGSAST